MDNLYLRAPHHVCLNISEKLRTEVNRWNLLVFYEKYSIDIPKLKASLPLESELKVLSSQEMEKEADKIRV